MSKITEFILCLFALSLVVWIGFDINDKHQFIATSKQEQKQAVVIQKDMNYDSLASIVAIKVKFHVDSQNAVYQKENQSLIKSKNQLYEEYIHDITIASVMLLHVPDSTSSHPILHRLIIPE